MIINQPIIKVIPHFYNTIITVHDTRSFNVSSLARHSMNRARDVYDKRVAFLQAIITIRVHGRGIYRCRLSQAKRCMLMLQ